MNIREETPADLAVIRQIVDDAFAGAEHSGGTEGQIVEKLRAAGALTLSLVAEEAGQALGPCCLFSGAHRTSVHRVVWARSRCCAPGPAGGRHWGAAD